jgi:predicted AAA+ superfamily ATPase
MLQRTKENTLIQRLKQFPAVVLVGPRQSGKTTLAKKLKASYYDLESEGERLRLDLEWPKIVEGTELVVLDEAQSFPEIFPRLRSAIDSNRKSCGRFLLLGSIAPSLMREVSESLAGRAAVVELGPLSLPEIPYEKLDELWRCGGFPEGGVLESARYPTWQESYMQLLIQRDLPNLGLPARPLVTERMLKMIAAVHAQEWNASKIGASLGLNYQTINSYLEYFHGAFLTRALTPFETNLKKRLVKHPKLYIRDSGLLHVLLGLARSQDMLAQPWVGASWEGFVIEQILANLDTSEGTPTPNFLRSGAAEIDLILRYRGEIWAFEIKLTSEPTREHVKNLRTLGVALGATRRILVHRGRVRQRGEDCELMPLEDVIREVGGG